ncbi:SEC-C motif domain protein [Desulfofarcimen acetoxidans DSM 771]|uniref:SEC-C motif domain protein n=1 Tax=Desulfofarcimen acetoxidans (strain ATCC 49208 / DSM 771 / KCTC 5769 / VKM B-1644 / 5575) TaxID=485916 RepID=C8VVT1_DESAS|nr:SEC-C metal-binding domain-containing protein [Desulfofarcimen acetoxidans]ACV62396.1 SEC-C motif domain protein [Desulfofarcimen acetoxidans DSM 771]
MDLDQIKQYLSQHNMSDFDANIKAYLKELKAEAVAQNNEALANEIWCLETISEIQRAYISAFNSIKDGKHFDAWNSYDSVDIKLSFLRKHFDYSGNLYDLEFIEEYTRKYQKLFPYQFFMSREAVIKKESCSICGRINTIRSRCEHEVGGLYMGEMCCRVVEDVEFLAESIVTNPFDKCTVLFPEGMEYNYEALDILFKGLDTPYDRWMLEIEKRLKPEFVGAQRNAPCPCGSAKKYKKCCYGTDSELMDHNKITLLDRSDFTPVPYKTMGTWKEKEQK